MKKLSLVIISIMLAVIMTVMPSAQVSAAAESGEYISEMKLGIGATASIAEKALNGYEILKDENGKNVDLNQKAGGGTLSKGEKVVYLGYKRTSSKYNAITDLAVMSMKGGYSTEDYDALMENTYIKQQIIPFVDSFISTIEEYRANYHSKNTSNKLRAQYLHDALNKLTDDDCGGAGLGDLLLNQTKYEINDDVYNKLSDEKKKKHADIVTIIAQANGQATLLLENLLTRAADTNENTWLDRMVQTSYDDLVDETGLSPSKAKKELDKLYYDDAEKILDMWDEFKKGLDGYDNAVELLEEESGKDYTKQQNIIENYDMATATDKQTEEYGKTIAEVQNQSEIVSSLYADVVCKEYLETVEYEDGTLLDFFKQSSDDIKKDMTVLYPMIASLSDGQRAGLDFVTMEDLIMLGATDENGYKDAELDELEVASVYEGVDRGIYEKGGVGLTSEAQRSGALQVAQSDSSSALSALTFAFYGATGASVVAFGVTAAAKIKISKLIIPQENHAAYLDLAKEASDLLKSVNKSARDIRRNIKQVVLDDAGKAVSVVPKEGMATLNEQQMLELFNSYTETNSTLKGKLAQMQEIETFQKSLQAKSSLCNKLMVGFTVAMIVFTAVSLYFTYQDMVDYYKVDFTPIPRYMIDEKDLIDYNENNEKIVLKNQTAYYKAILCNRTDEDEMYKTVGDVGDLNGDVGKQWLALYAERNNGGQPILADSFKVVLKNAEVPAGYSTGIHFFGTEAAENLNNTLYVWNSSAPKIYVYYKTDEGTGAEGSSFTIGYIAIAAGAGLLIGALVTAVCMNAVSKKKKKIESV